MHPLFRRSVLAGAAAHSAGRCLRFGENGHGRRGPGQPVRRLRDAGSAHALLHDVRDAAECDRELTGEEGRPLLRTPGRQEDYFLPR